MMDFDSLIKGVKAGDSEAVGLLWKLFGIATPVPVAEGSYGGKIYPEGTVFCPRCGRLWDYEEECRYCPDCGQRLDWSGYLSQFTDPEEEG